MSTSFELHTIYAQHFDSPVPVKQYSSEQQTSHDTIENGANSNFAAPRNSAFEVNTDEFSRENLYFQPEVKHVIQYPQDNLSEEVFVVSADSYLRRRIIEDPNRPFKEFSILLRKILNKYGRLTDVHLELQSKGLCELVQRIGRPVRGLVNLDVCPIVFQKPFRALLFLNAPLQEFRNTTTDMKLKEEVESLLKLIHSPDGIQASLSAYEQQIQIGRVTFSLLWALYPAETIVYFNNSVIEECGVVESTEYVYIEKTFENRLRVNVLRGYHSGKQFGVTRTHYHIPSFPGYFDINTENLPIIPLAFLPAERRSTIRKKLVKRGRRFCDLQCATMNHFAYDGPFWKSDPQPLDFRRPRMPPKDTDNPDPTQQVEIKGRVIIDSGALLSLNVQHSADLVAPSLERFFRQNTAPDPNDKAEDGSTVDSSSVSISAAEKGLEELFNFNSEDSMEMTEDEYLICRPDIRGFFLNEQQWGAFLVGNLKNIEWSENAFDHLQMKLSDKKTIERLVTGFDPSERIDFNDTIRGKGKGLVFLLHGEPGLGKTMTAESIAEHARRPLYHVTTGQLGTDVMFLERYLDTIFKLGHRWRAVLLLDEADVLMSQRTQGDLHRNAIVAVFLRLMEYYSGLLFLTTNRLEGFDSAFYNRIHVKIRYPPLGLEARSNIWRNLLNGAHPARLDDSWSEALYGLLGKLNTNGRDIRNIVRLAHGLAAGAEDRGISILHVMDAVRINCSEDESEKHKEIERVSELIHEVMTVGSSVDSA